ncbi:G8 domain-containing protein DDB_G0286897 [Hondaea fermentalgiana]|uniref:G8 domain-containing protein DDB_G0286897 n=1 Tax=Hondaea fermentalgiana TaxID=2315210 RepID=A0A2R5GTS5_9STRA|nr:G8 domain-containing protein DDB_G0286897 [Hondaea fermentalgiana]|eukprot:GBG34262.1 G8 domain-containing protein DDB_G0286897 [Hondaea fermentalgiana]
MRTHSLSLQLLHPRASGNKLWSQYYMGFEWYDTHQRHIIGGITFRNCGDATSSSPVWRFPTHSDRYTPGFIQATRNVKDENADTSMLIRPSISDYLSVSGYLANWLDADGTVLGSEADGPKTVGAARGGIDISSFTIAYDEAVDAKFDDSPICGYGHQIGSPRVGYVVHLGYRDPDAAGQVSLPIKVNPVITGPSNGLDWLSLFEGASLVSIDFKSAQIDEDDVALIAIPYSSGVTISLHSVAAYWCNPVWNQYCDHKFTAVKTLLPSSSSVFQSGCQLNSTNSALCAKSACDASAVCVDYGYRMGALPPPLPAAGLNAATGESLFIKPTQQTKIKVQSKIDTTETFQQACFADAEYGNFNHFAKRKRCMLLRGKDHEIIRKNEWTAGVLTLSSREGGENDETMPTTKNEVVAKATKAISDGEVEIEMVEAVAKLETRLRTAYDVFLSHSWKVDSHDSTFLNHTRVKDVKESLEEEFKLRCWFDTEDLQGSDMSLWMADGINESHVVLMCLSPDYMDKIRTHTERNYCKLEYSHAFKHKKTSVGSDTVICVHMTDSVNDRWAPDLAEMVYVSLADDDFRNLEALAFRILAEIFPYDAAEEREKLVELYPAGARNFSK